MRRISEVVLTFGYVGYLPRVPGTWGSAATALLLVAVPRSAPFLAPAIVTATALVGVGCYLSKHVEEVFGRRDPGPVVLDEVVGMLFATAFAARPDLPLLLCAFLLFRIFDVVKPFPARQLERLPGGFGIFMDDVMAGLYTNALLRLFLLFA